MNLRAQINYWLSLNQLTYEKLAVELTRITGKKYTRGSINAKLSRGSMSVREFETIAGFFGYKLEVLENK